MINALNAAASKIREAQAAERSAIMIQLKEVVSGVRGFVSITERDAQMAGITKGAISSVAARMGLVSRLHGKYGTCFSRPRA